MSHSTLMGKICKFCCWMLGISILLIGFATAVLLFYDNTDHATRSLRIKETEVHMYSFKYHDQFHSFQEEHNQKETKTEQPLSAKESRVQNSCLMNPNAVSTPKEQLQSFIEGDCAPVIVLPGLMATKLMVQIDCETLMEHHPEIMEASGWSTCSWSLWGSRPASEYLLWIGTLHSPVSPFSFDGSTCFGRFVNYIYNASADNIHDKYVFPKGTKVTWYGNTPDTMDDADGGFSAVSDLFPLPIQVAATKGFSGLGKHFSNLGYQKGLTLFAIPYNFLLTYHANEVSYTLERTIRYAYTLTGKKVVIVGHSLGNLNVLPALNSMSQEDKDLMVSSYVAITPPFGGVPKTLQNALGGDPSFRIGMGYGVNAYNQARIMEAASSTQDLTPKDVFHRFRNEAWMQDLLARIELEKSHGLNSTQESSQDLESIPYSFFPPPTEKCFNGFTERAERCQLDISDLATEPVATIQGKHYHANGTSMREIFSERYAIGQHDDFFDKWNDSLKSNADEMQNPNVPIVFIYGSHLPSDFRYEWDYPPENNTRRGLFAFPSRVIRTGGDKTIPLSSTLPTAFKWAWEHIHRGTNENVKSIKITEYCSTYNKSGSLWDGRDASGALFMNTTSYIGLPCQCGENIPTLGKECFHAGMINDPYLINYIGVISRTHQRVTQKETTVGFRLSNQAIIELQSSLPSLRRPREDQDVMKWFEEPMIVGENNSTFHFNNFCTPF